MAVSSMDPNWEPNPQPGYMLWDRTHHLLVYRKTLQSTGLHQLGPVVNFDRCMQPLTLHPFTIWNSSICSALFPPKAAVYQGICYQGITLFNLGPHMYGTTQCSFDLAFFTRHHVCETHTAGVPALLLCVFCACICQQ